MIYTIKKLLDTDLNNSKEINMKDIITSLEIEYTNNTTEEFIDKINQLYLKLNETRQKTFHKQFIEFLNHRAKKESKEAKTNREEILKEFTENILTNELVSDVARMCLPMEDKNSTNTEVQFINDRLNLAIILRRMGKIEESENLLNIEKSKIYTFTSYTKEWKMNQRNKYKNIPVEILNEILKNVISKVKEYNSNEKIKEITNNHIRIDKKNQRKFHENLAIIKGAQFADNMKISNEILKK